MHKATSMMEESNVLIYNRVLDYTGKVRIGIKPIYTSTIVTLGNTTRSGVQAEGINTYNVEITSVYCSVIMEVQFNPTYPFISI
jgi:hypothetical protein